MLTGQRPQSTSEILNASLTFLAATAYITLILSAGATVFLANSTSTKNSTSLVAFGALTAISLCAAGIIATSAATAAPPMTETNGAQTMGEAKLNISVGNPNGQDFRDLEATAGTGATVTQLPATLLAQLGVPVERSLQSELADGSTSPIDMGRTWIRINGQHIFTPVLFASEGEPTLLGAISLEEAFLTADPVNNRLVPAERIRR